MAEQLLVNFKDYWNTPVKPRGFKEFVEMLPSDGRIRGIWELTQYNPRTGEIAKRIWASNVITDQGANSMLQRAVNSLGATLPALFNNLLITNNSGSTQLTGAGFTAGQTGITTIPCNALPAAIPSGTYLVLDYGQGSAQGGYVNNVLPVSPNAIITSGVTAQGATSITVLAFTSAASHSAGANIVPLPMVTDNPNNAGLTSNATTPLSQYSGNLATGAFVFTPTSGAGNRSVVVTYEFDNATNGGTTPNGSYTDNWIVNVSSGATTNDYFAHEINPQMQVNNNASIKAVATAKV